MSEKRKVTRDEIEQERQQRIQQCNEQITATLQEFDCEFRVKLDITEDGRTVGYIQLLSKI